MDRCHHNTQENIKTCHFQHILWIYTTKTSPQGSPFQEHQPRSSLKIAPLQDQQLKQALKLASFHNNPATSHAIMAACDIPSLILAFPNSFDTIRSMPVHYTIHLGPNVQPVQHARHEVLIESHEKKEEKTSGNVQLKSHSPCHTAHRVGFLPSLALTSPMAHYIFNPCDLNKAILLEYYKTPTWDEFSHQLNGATTFSKPDVKKRLCSIHLDEANSSHH